MSVMLARPRPEADAAVSVSTREDPLLLFSSRLPLIAFRLASATLAKRCRLLACLFVDIDPDDLPRSAPTPGAVVFRGARRLLTPRSSPGRRTSRSAHRLVQAACRVSTRRPLTQDRTRLSKKLQESRFCLLYSPRGGASPPSWLLVSFVRRPVLFTLTFIFELSNV